MRKTHAFALAAALLLPGCTWRQAVAEAEAGRALSEEGKTDDARGRFEHALSLDPDIVGAHHGLALLYLGAGDLPRAISELELELDRHPDNDDARLNLAIAQVRLGRPADALRRLGEMQGEETADRALVKSVALLHQGDAVAARALAEKTAAAQPSAFASYLLGLIAAVDGRPDEAVTALEQAIRQDPKWPAPYLALGLVRDRSGEARKGATEVLPVIKLAPKDADGPLLAGLLLLRSGNAVGARDQLDAALALDGERSGIRNALAVARSVAGDQRGATEVLEEELAKHPNLAVAHRNRAVLLYRNGDLEGARVAFARALKLDPADGASKKALEALDRTLPPTEQP